MPRLSTALIALCLFALPACADTKPKLFQSKDYALKVATVADELFNPWGLAFLPDGAMLVTERGRGTIRIVDADGTPGPLLSGTPDVAVFGQGGMLDVALDPDFKSNNLIYFTYSEPGDGGAGTAAARGVLDRARNAVRDVQVIFRQVPKARTGQHFGSRLVFARDGRLFITIGERGQMELAQDTTVNRGQVIRIERDGRIPADNPFVGKEGARPEIWSYGHRNPQGAALHPETGKLWTVEHGARGGDEINVPLAGRNYGWPIISYGTHYSGAKIGVGTAKDGMEQPIYYWDPSIAPGGMTFYTGDKFPKWRGNAFVSALKFEMLARLTLDGEKIVAEERLLDGLDKRLRTVVQGPDGYLYLLVDDQLGQILKVMPAE